MSAEKKNYFPGNTAQRFAEIPASIPNNLLSIKSSMLMAERRASRSTNSDNEHTFLSVPQQGTLGSTIYTFADADTSVL